VAELDIDRGGVVLSGEVSGDGPPVVLLHGLTATRRYVVMGSTALQRGGHRVIAYDARGHGRSDPALSPDEYGYEQLGLDLIAVMDGAGVQQAVLAGASMGAHTLLWLALNHPERVGGMVVITPAYGADRFDDPERLERWDALSDGLRNGVEGFVAAYGEPAVPEKWRETVFTVIRQRLSQHEHPDAVADALRAVPRSKPFQGLEQLSAISVPTAVVASNDEADPGHPRAIAEAYAAVIPGARLITDEPGRSPVAWQGNQLSRVIAEVVQETLQERIRRSCGRVHSYTKLIGPHTSVQELSRPHQEGPIGACRKRQTCREAGTAKPGVSPR
jgi:pimeloyl-ACP methyl ester carboxylesterase